MAILSRAFRRTLLRLESGPLTDGQLLERFAKHQDQAAFEELVRRHGPMVLRVCTRVLRHAQDAEDAFQAIWIVLARKAGAIAEPERVAGWLHGVACRVALQAKQSVSQARKHERHGAEAASADLAQSNSSDAAASNEARAVLDEEVNRLPPKYRAPVVLCYLEGKSTDEVAHQLAWPRGTVAIRLSRARDLLRQRLARRGLALSEAALAGVLTQETASAAVVTALTAQAALIGSDGQAPAARAAALAEATLRTLAPSTPRIAAASLVAVVVLSAGAAVLVQRLGTPATQPAQNGLEAATLVPPPAVPEGPVYVHWDPLRNSFGTTFHQVFDSRWGEARSAAWSSDGKILATGHAHGAVSFSQRLESPKPGDAAKPPTTAAVSSRGLAALRAHADHPVTNLAFSPDRKTLASLAGNERAGELVLWDLSTLNSMPAASATLTWRLVPARWTSAANLVFTPDGATLIQHIGLSAPILWDVASATPKPLQLPKDCVAMGVSPDGTTLAWYRRTTKDLVAWDVATKQERRLVHLDGDLQPSKITVAMSGQAKRVALEVEKDNRVRVLLVDMASGKWGYLREPAWSDWPCSSLQFSPDGSVLLKAGKSAQQQLIMKLQDGP